MTAFWYTSLIYTLIFLLFLASTLREQRRNQVPWSGTAVGFVLGVIWPVTVLAVLVMTLRALALEKAASKRSA